MATSGIFTGSRGGSSTGPWLTLYWERTEVDIPNNRSRLYLRLRLHSDRSLYFSANKSGYLEGTSFTYTGGFSGTGYRTLYTKSIWVNHDSDGSKVIWLNGDLDIGVNWGGSWVSNIDVAGNAYIDDIPRSSDLTAFTLDNTYLAVSSSRIAEYTIDRKHSSFSHHFWLKFDDTTITQWNDSGDGPNTHTLWTNEMNNIINLMPNKIGGWLTLEMQTKDGSSNIGSRVSKRRWVELEAGIKPQVGQLNVDIYGTGRDDVIGKYVQNISRVSYSFTTAEPYGATITSEKVTIQKQSDGSNSQVINGDSGVTPNPVTKAGTYEVIAYSKDSRGREDTYTTTFTVDAYSAPKIHNFGVSRNASTTSNVNAAVDVTWSIGGSNPTDVTIVGVGNSGTSDTLYDLNGSTTGSLDTIQTYTGQSDASSYEYTITVEDSFGRTATAKSSVGTSFVEFTVAKGQGVGVGKVHEKGALDVGGPAHFDASAYFYNYIYLNELKSIVADRTNNDYPIIDSNAGNGDVDLFRIGNNSSYGYNLMYRGSGSGNDNDLIQYSDSSTSGPRSSIVYRAKQDGGIYFANDNMGFTGNGRADFRVARYSDGYNMASIRNPSTAHNDPIFIQSKKIVVSTSSADNGFLDISYPVALREDPYWVIAQNHNGSSSAYANGVYNITSSGCRIYISHISDYEGSFSIDVWVIIAGRK